MKSMKSYKHKHRLKGNKSKEIITPIEAYAYLVGSIFYKLLGKALRDIYLKRLPHE